MIEKKFTIFKKCTILIVDDDVSLLNDLQVVLEFFFQKVLTASNGLEALKIFKNNTIDVVFSDYVMPKMNGATLCREIRTIDYELPFVILSNYSDKEKLLSLIDLQLSGYIIKPYSFDDITNVLKKIVSILEKRTSTKVYLNENLYFDKHLKKVVLNGEDMKLTKNEVLLIELFSNNPNKLLTQDLIDYTLNPHKPISYQASKNVMYRIRKKIGKDVIKNIQSVGYIFETKENNSL